MKQGNFIYMLAGLLLLLLLAPSFTKYFPSFSGVLVQATLMTLMVIGVWSLKGSVWFTTGITLAGIGVLLSITNFFMQSQTFYLISVINVLLFCVISCYAIMKQILFKGEINANKLIGSVCVYLLLGLIWAMMYTIIAYFDPMAFKGIGITSEQLIVWEYVYYSFVTITTLGYGDISPVFPLAKSLAYLEAICGQLYLAILVASLVSAYITKKNNPS